MKPSSIGEIERAHARQEHERLGQYFVNRYIAGNWAELFYEPDYKKAREMIISWLIDNQYTFDMPPKVRDL